MNIITVAIGLAFFCAFTVMTIQKVRLSICEKRLNEVIKLLNKKLFGDERP